MPDIGCEEVVSRFELREVTELTLRSESRRMEGHNVYSRVEIQSRAIDDAFPRREFVRRGPDGPDMPGG